MTHASAPGTAVSRFVLDRYASLAAAFAFAIGAVVLAGWVVGVDELTSLGVRRVEVKANTAVALCLAALASWLAHGNGTRRRPWLVALSGGAVALVALLTLAQYVGGADLGLDELLVSDETPARATSHPGRMGPNTALALAFLGLGLALLASARRGATRIAHALLVGAAAVAFLALVGYAVGVPGFYRLSSWTQMSPVTAVTLLVLATGALAGRADFLPVRLVATTGAAGTAARRLLPAAIVLPLALAWVCRLGEDAGLYSRQVSDLLLVGSLVAALLALVLTLAVAMERSARTRAAADEARRAAEARYRALVEQLPLVTYVDKPDATATSIYISPQVEELLGYAPDEWLADPELFPKILHPEDRERVLADHEAKYAKDEGWSLEYRVVARDGRTVWLRDDAVVLRDDAGKPLFIQGFLIDITAEKEAEESLRVRNEELAALHETAMGVLRGLDVNTLLETILARAGDLAGTAHAYLYLVDRDELEVRLGTGMFEGTVGYRLRRGEGAAGKVYETGLPLALDDYHVWANRRRDLDALGFHALVGVPLRSGDEVVGVLGLAHTDPARRITPDETALLERFSDLVSLALENARLYAAAQEELGERRRTEEALRESEERFRSLVSNVPGAIFRCRFDSSWRFEFISEAIEEISGYPAEEFLSSGGRTLTSLVHGDDRAGVRTTFEAAARSGDDYALEYRIVRADGEVRWVLERGRGTPGEDGTLLLDAAIFDITERRRAEEALQESQRQLAHAQSVAHVGSWHWDVATDAVSWSDELYRIHGLEPGAVEMTYASIREFVHPEDLETFDAAVVGAYESGEPFVFDYRIVRPDGRVRWLHARGDVIRRDGRSERMLGTAQDVSEHREAEEKLRTAELRYRTLVEHLPLGTYIRPLDLSSGNLYASPQVEEMLGYSVAEWREDPELLARIVHPDDRELVLNEAARVRRTGEPFRGEYRYVARDGRTVWVRDETYVVRDDDGKPYCVQGYLLDITEEKRASAERDRLLREAQEAREALTAQNERLLELDRLKDEFIALVSHELRTPLTSIRGYLELVLEDELSDEHRAFLEVVERNSHRLLRLVSDLLFLAQIEAGKLALDEAPLNLADVIGESVDVARPLAEAKEISLSMTAAPPAPVHGDRARIAQVLDNLVSNAIKFTPAGGRVEVRTRVEAGTAVIAVADTGMGIPANEQAQLFERFFRTSSATKQAIQGTGLGLSISKAIVEAHGGEIGVESEEGSGTTVTVALPLREASANGSDERLVLQARD